MLILLIVSAISTLFDPAPLNLNTASVAELVRLHGIGNATATAIIEYRENISTFASVEELLFVSGIGSATLEAIYPFITIPQQIVPINTYHFLPESALEDTLLTVVFLDIGNGDAILLQTEETTWLIDGGPPGNGAVRAPVVYRLMECGIDSLSVIAFTHPHADHIGGCRDALEIFHCDTLYDPGIDHASPVYEDLLQFAYDNGTKYFVLSGEDKWNLSEEVVLEVAWIQKNAGNPNDASAIYQVTCKNFSMLLTGDIENSVLRQITQQQTPVTVMKVPHHGSRTSLFPPWFRKCSPQFAIFCCGRDNPFGHPHSEVIEAWETTNCDILRTDELGNIFLYTDGESINFNSSL